MVEIEIVIFLALRVEGIQHLEGEGGGGVEVVLFVEVVVVWRVGVEEVAVAETEFCER